MDLAGKHAVVTGGASGIGRALCERFGAEDMAVVVSDVQAPGAEATAASITADGGRAHAVVCDVRAETQVRALVEAAVDTYGPIDLFCSNAGITSLGGIDASDETWERAFDTNFFAHVYAVRAVLPAMLERGDGYLLHTASAAGLLTQVGDLPYSVTKHAVVALAEWLAISYGDAGIKVSCLCPQGVNTAMLGGGQGPRTEGPEGPGRGVVVAQGVLEPEEVADAVVDALHEERFLVLPHPEVAEYFRRKASDYDRWLNGMRRLRARYDAPRTASD